MARNLATKVVKAYPMGDSQRGYVVDVECPLCSIAQQHYVKTQEDRYYMTPVCDPTGRFLLEFNFSDETLSQLARQAKEASRT